MKIKNLPPTERPVEKCISYGIESLSNYELLAILLGSGNREKSAIGLAEEIIARDKSGIRYLMDTSIEELMQISGVGEKKAARIAAALELGKRISSFKPERKFRIDIADDVADILMEDMRYDKKESLKAILLNVKKEVISVETISIGGLSNAPVHPRDIFSPAIKKGASAIILAHNHPSGDPTPSDADIAATRSVIDSGKTLGIYVLDHVIIGDNRFTSMAEEGYI